MPLIKTLATQVAHSHLIVASATFLLLFYGIGIASGSMVTTAKADTRLTKDITKGAKQFEHGLSLAKQGQLNRAIAVFKTLNKNYPQWPEPFNNLAVLYERLGRHAEAVAALEAALNTHPSYATAHQNLTRIYDNMASKAYEKAFALNSKNKSNQPKLSLIERLRLPPSTATPVTLARQATPPPKASPKRVVLAQEGRNTRHSAAQAVEVKDEKHRLLDIVRNWAQAWSQQDVGAYLSFYSPRFRPARGKKIDTWRKERHLRLTTPRRIQVTLSNIRVININDKQARVRLHQLYQSDNFKSDANKQMVFEKSGDNWKILVEQVLRETLQ